MKASIVHNNDSVISIFHKSDKLFQFAKIKTISNIIHHMINIYLVKEIPPNHWYTYHNH